MPFRLAVQLLLILTVACTTPRLPRQVSSLVHQQVRLMESHEAVDEWVAALRIARGVQTFDPVLADYCTRLEAFPEEVQRLFGHDRLGVNVSLRRDVQAGLGERVAWWLPDRLLDLLDVFSFDLRFGYGLAADVHLTRAAALAAGGSASLGVGWHEQRSLGVRVANQGGWRFGSAGGGFDWGFDVGTGERRVGGGRREAGAEPDDLLYQEWRDYWSLGASVHALLLGAEFDFHPVELADFLGGLVGFDLGHDDRATTRAEPLAGTGSLDLQILRECLIDVRTMEQWALYRERLSAGAETDALKDTATGDGGHAG